MAESAGTILIVEPDEHVRHGYQVALARAGFRAVAASDGATALRLATRLVPAAVLTEIRLPHLSGFHLASRLRRQASTRHVQIVAVTSYADDDLAKRASEAGIDAVLRKPGTTTDLVRALRAAVRQGAALREQAGQLVSEVDHEIRRGRQLVSDVRRKATHGAPVPPEGAGMPAGGDVRVADADSDLLRDADGARDVMAIDEASGLRLFEELKAKYGDHPLLRYKRGEAYRAIGRRKLAYAEFAAAAELFADEAWRERARFAAMRTRSHHEPSTKA